MGLFKLRERRRGVEARRRAKRDLGLTRRRARGTREAGEYERMLRGVAGTVEWASRCVARLRGRKDNWAASGRRDGLKYRG